MPTRYHPALVVLHWLLALMIIVALIMGSQSLAATPNSDPAKLDGLRAHMTVGIAILVLMLVRLVIRLRTAHPPEADIGNAALNAAARLAHSAFYVLVFAMCASGIAISVMAGLPAIVFGGSGAPLPADFSAFAPRAVHGAIATLLGLLILGHIAAVLYHQFVRKDGLLSRMGFGRRGS